MKLMQRILSHGLLITMIVVVFLLFIYRAELFPGWFAGGDRTESEPRTMQAEDSPRSAPPADRTEKEAEAPPVSSGQTEAPASSALPPMVGDPVPVSGTGADVNDVARDPATPASSAQYRPVAEDATVAADEDTSWADSERAGGDDGGNAARYRPLPDETPDAGTEISPEQVVQLLADARGAYWRHEIEAAEKLYLEATRAVPPRPEIWGELGNLYFSQGRWNEAAESYYKAAEGFVHRGDRAQATGLLRVIEGLDREKARLLEERMGDGND